MKNRARRYREGVFSFCIATVESGDSQAWFRAQFHAVTSDVAGVFRRVFACQKNARLNKAKWRHTCLQQVNVELLEVAR